VPQCAACHFGKASKVLWQVKGNPKDGQLFQTTVAGQVVSVDQLKSTVPGFVGQMKGWLTNQRYHVATVFVDHYSRISYVHLQKSDTSAETVIAKQALEGYACTMGVQIQHYHTDNGRFANNLFMKDILDQKQTIMFCRVNAHFQSRIAERRICELQDGTWTSLIHAKHRWGTAINMQLWPYALRHRNDVNNSMQCNPQELSPLEIFSNSKVQPKLRHFHLFGCPAYQVEASIQLGKNHPKWMSRSDPVVYVSSSPRHARSVSLALDLNTAHVLPQFHLRYDNLFETMSDRQVNPPARVLKWQSLAGFQETPNKPQKGVSMAHANIDVGKLNPHPVTPPALPVAPDILHDPDGDRSIAGDQPSRKPLVIDSKVGPLGNPVDTTNPTGACRSALH
jgi:hypothetical protein